MVFQNVDLPNDIASRPAGPKLLLIEEGRRLSWHVHERKDASLRVLVGTVSQEFNETDDLPGMPSLIAAPSPLLATVRAGMRHRFGSLTGWAVIAEIARHVFPDYPSDDNDTRRIQDDFGR